jgi:hypothetical protein
MDEIFASDENAPSTEIRLSMWSRVSRSATAFICRSGSGFPQNPEDVSKKVCMKFDESIVVPIKKYRGERMFSPLLI